MKPVKLTAIIFILAIAASGSAAYEMIWKQGDFTDSQKQKIERSFKRIGKRTNQLLGQITVELNLLKHPKYAPLVRELNNLRFVLNKIKQGINSTAENLELYQVALKKPDTLAQAVPGRWYLYAPQLLYNSTTSGRKWYELREEDLDVLNFHELSHFYGTEDDDSKGELMNAATLQVLMYLDLKDHIVYDNLKRQVEKSK
ncbi:MAG: hypothetical protein ABR969_00345 [Sedimentisphaerales bacterium]